MRTWQGAGPVLEQLRRRELREMTEEEASRRCWTSSISLRSCHPRRVVRGWSSSSVTSPSPAGEPDPQAAAEIDCFCTERGLQFCIIGGHAVLRWGQPRLTRDVDLTIVAGFGTEQSVIDPLLEQFDMRLDDGAQR